MNRDWDLDYVLLQYIHMLDALQPLVPVVWMHCHHTARLSSILQDPWVSGSSHLLLLPFYLFIYYYFSCFQGIGLLLCVFKPFFTTFFVVASINLSR